MYGGEMFRLAAMAVVALVAGLAVACGEGGGEVELTPATTATPPPSASATVTATATPTPSPSAAPGTAVPDEIAGERIVFLRSAIPYADAGELWISRVDGGDRERLSREGEVVKFAGIANDYASGNETVYYVSLDGELERTLWALDHATGERTPVVAFEAFRDRLADAAVSPDGRYAVYADAQGIEMLDRSSGRTKHLLDNGSSDCTGSCFMHSRPRWSQDGRLVMVRKTFYEGGTTVVVEPFGVQIQTYTNDSAVGPWTAEWSTVGRALCGFGSYGEASGLLVADAPDWEFANVVPGNDADREEAVFVAACSWFDGSHVAYGANIWREGESDVGPVPRISVQVRVHDLESGEDRIVDEFGGPEQTYSGELVAFPGTSLVVTQRSVDDDGNGSGEWTRPELIDVDTGERTWVLEEGDVLVGLAQ